MKSTPGPWKVEENYHWNRKVNVVPATGKDWRTIAFVQNLNESDARLIAQAPSMLDALKDVLDALGALNKWWELVGHGFDEKRAKEILSIIRAAEGDE
jgi:hypothetical protein